MRIINKNNDFCFYQDLHTVYEKLVMNKFILDRY